MLNILASLRAELGELSRIRSFVKVLVFVHYVDTYAEHHLVADGASELVAALLTDHARHARSAVGMMSLPLGIFAEIEAIAAVGNG
jgi:enamine deaminase RidA (YjgF/YER057c/UK114 family)